jgi:hypothetical protein
MLRETELSLCLVETKALVISISLQMPARSCNTAWIDYIAKHSEIIFLSMLCDLYTSSLEVLIFIPHPSVFATQEADRS